MDKAPEAFRTISEVAEALETPAHVLRFWESRFPQIKPVKRAGGRRYYRPADVALLSGIRHLLHSEGMTIRGVQKVLREQGVRHVAALGGADISALDLEADGDDTDQTGAAFAAYLAAQAGSGAQIMPIDSLPRKTYEAGTAPNPTQTAEIQPLFSALSALVPRPPPVNQPVNPLVNPPTGGALDPSVPYAGAGGFVAFSNPRRPRPKSLSPGADDPLQPNLPLTLDRADTGPEAGFHQTTVANARLADRAVADGPAPKGHAAPDSPAPPDTVPEAPHIWAEPEPEPEAVRIDLPSAWQSRPDPAPEWAAPDLPASSAPKIAEPHIGPDTAFDVASRTLEDAEPDAVSTKADAESPATAPDAAIATSQPYRPDTSPDPDPTPQPASADAPDLSGLAARLRALTNAPDRSALQDLHARLGLLHAQMAEALRLRR